MATTDQWRTIEGWAEHLTGEGHDPTAACLLDLRRRVEALEQRRAATEESSATEPAPAADRPLWRQMHLAYYEVSDAPEDWAAVLDAVADWLDARAVGVDAIVALHAEARRAREGQ